MTPLETWLNEERGKRHPLRAALGRLAHLLPAPLRNPALNLAWDRRYRHMRFLPPEITLDRHPDGSWTICRNDLPIARSRPISELLARIDRPASIVATGPSALDYLWASVRRSERFLIAVNGAPTMLAKLGLGADLMVVTDREFCLTGMPHFEAAKNTPLVIEFLAAAALAVEAPHLLACRPFSIIERVNLWHGVPAISSAKLIEMNQQSGLPFVFPDEADARCRIGWSRRPDLGIFSGRTVVFGALQIAIGLGATDVEIIGMDLNGAGRAYDEGNKQRPTQLQQHYQEFILPSFQVMSRVLAGSNVSVRNISPACPLPDDIFTGLSQSNRREIL
jgi:KDO transferase-3